MENTINVKVTDMDIQAKKEALARHLDVAADTITESGGNYESSAERGEYSVYTDEEADTVARDYILERLWAFKYSFLQCHSEAIAEIPEKNFKEMQGELCESFNPAVKAMIDDIEHFIQDAINADGRGHFMSSYDGEEHEQDGFYIYRTN